MKFLNVLSRSKATASKLLCPHSQHQLPSNVNLIPSTHFPFTMYPYYPHQPQTPCMDITLILACLLVTNWLARNFFTPLSIEKEPVNVIFRVSGLPPYYPLSKESDWKIPITESRIAILAVDTIRRAKQKVVERARPTILTAEENRNGRPIV